MIMIMTMTLTVNDAEKTCKQIMMWCMITKRLRYLALRVNTLTTKEQQELKKLLEMYANFRKNEPFSHKKHAIRPLFIKEHIMLSHFSSFLCTYYSVGYASEQPLEHNHAMFKKFKLRVKSQKGANQLKFALSLCNHSKWSKSQNFNKISI